MCVCASFLRRTSVEPFSAWHNVCGNRIWLAALGNMAAPTTPPLRPQPKPTTPPKLRRQRHVAPGVSFMNALSSSVIWEVDERVSIGAALCETSRRTGVDMGKFKLFDDVGFLVYVKTDIDEAVISVVLLSE